MSRNWLLPLVPLYAAAAGAKNSAYEREWIRPDHLRWPVISVGNLSVGGAGKTPLVIRLAELLAAQGLAVDVLSRGYGRSSAATEVVDPAGSPARFGDEPLLIARRSGVPVFLGASRYAAGLLAEQRLRPGTNAVHLLDDGFQHRRLAREVDVVAVHRSDLDERLLPAGRLREPIRALCRARILVLREQDSDLEARLRQLGIVSPIWWMRRSIEIPSGIRRALAFCGIARPDEFFCALERDGVQVAGTRRFSDHHRYTPRDVDDLALAARTEGADCFVTTEKDAVKLDTPLRERLGHAGALHEIRLSVRLRDEAAVLRDLIERIGGGSGQLPDTAGSSPTLLPL